METDGKTPEVTTEMYPLCGKCNAFKTLQCKLDPEDVSSARSAIDALFEQYTAAVRYCMDLVPQRGTCREAFTRQDKARLVDITPGLDKDLRTTALDKAIEMWKSFRASSRFPKTKNIIKRPGAVRFPKKDYCLMEGPDMEGPIRQGLRVCFPTPKGNIELLILGKDRQVQILRSCMKGEQRCVRSFGELLWRGEDLYMDIHIGRQMSWIARAFPVISTQVPVPVGVDIGARKLLVAAVPQRGRKGVLFIDGGPLRHKRRCILKDKERAYHNEDLGAHLEARERDRGAIMDAVHKAARALVDHARKFNDPSKNEFAFIVLEDLKFQDASALARQLGSDTARELKGWPFGTLRTVIIEKAAWDSVPVMFVPPQGTSTTCPKCGSIKASRRPDRHMLVCPACNFSANDDYCAALNIANRGLGLLPIATRREIRAGLAITSYKRRGASGPSVAGDVDAPRGLRGHGCGGTTAP
jgi:IS605 OrfB family transposase